MDGSLLEHVTSVDVPVYFFTGRFDYTTPFELIELYHDRLEAPAKKMVWFEKSAHFPFFEEPEKFPPGEKSCLESEMRLMNPLRAICR
jgi:pimeloyl-ACP methyl ester carboxylesterase